MAYLRSFWQVRTPTTDDGIANKAYVDDEIADAIEALDLSGLGTGGTVGVDIVDITHSTSGAVAIDYDDGAYFRITVTAAANITGLTRANIPAGFTSMGLLIVNEHSAAITVDISAAAGLVPYEPLDSAVSVAAGALLWIGGAEWN